MNKHSIIVALALLAATSTGWAQTAWTLDDCLRHAREANIQLQKARVSEQAAAEDLASAKAQLLPSLSFSMSQSVSYRPWQETGAAMVNDGKATSTSSETTQSGTYNLGANWTLWNGGQNQLRVKQEELNGEMAALTTAQQLATVEESIMRYFVQIQYLAEAVEVCRKICETSEKQYERGEELLAAGKMSKADLAQLEAQLANARYDVVSAQAQVESAKRQLKELLQIAIDQPFDIAAAPLPDSQAEAVVPAKGDVFNMAVASRAEIKSAEKNVSLADLQLKSAKGGYWPTVGLSASMGTSHYTGARTAWGEQMKSNLNMGASVNVSVPIFDNRANKTNVRKARLNQVTAQLDLADKQTVLASAIDDYYIQATTSQQKFLAARVAESSQQASYELLNEQFNCGLKNIVELLQGRDKLLQAAQEKLQDKYTTILAIAMLHYYAGEGVNL